MAQLDFIIESWRRKYHSYDSPLDRDKADILMDCIIDLEDVRDGFYDFDDAVSFWKQQLKHSRRHHDADMESVLENVLCDITGMV